MSGESQSICVQYSRDGLGQKWITKSTKKASLVYVVNCKSGVTISSPQGPLSSMFVGVVDEFPSSTTPKEFLFPKNRLPKINTLAEWKKCVRLRELNTPKNINISNAEWWLVLPRSVVELKSDLLCEMFFIALWCVLGVNIILGRRNTSVFYE